MGFFSKKRWIKRGDDSKKYTHEIAINPTYFLTHSTLEIFQTLVHEMCHLWQHEFGKPSQSYHNKQWANKMLSFDLIPSDTGLENGKITGQKMSDYVKKGGKFELACIAFEKQGYSLPYSDRYMANTVSAQIRDSSLTETIEDIDLYTPTSNLFELSSEEILTTKSKNKTKYSCPNCKINVWGKPEIIIICGKCNLNYHENI